MGVSAVCLPSPSAAATSSPPQMGQAWPRCHVLPAWPPQRPRRRACHTPPMVDSCSCEGKGRGREGEGGTGQHAADAAAKELRRTPHPPPAAPLGCPRTSKNSSRTKRKTRQLLPTPLLPSSTSLKWKLPRLSMAACSATRCPHTPKLRRQRARLRRRGAPCAAPAGVRKCTRRLGPRGGCAGRPAGRGVGNEFELRRRRGASPPRRLRASAARTAAILASCAHAACPARWPLLHPFVYPPGACTDARVLQRRRPAPATLPAAPSRRARRPARAARRRRRPPRAPRPPAPRL
jgi:hypothetical protein